LLEHVFSQARTSLDRGAQRPTSKHTSSAAQSLVGPLGHAARQLAELTSAEASAPVPAPPSDVDAQVRSSQLGLHARVRNWVGKLRMQAASLGQLVSLHPKMVQ
jgi:hypothetical protein